MPDDNVSAPPLPVAKGKPVSEALLNEKVRRGEGCLSHCDVPYDERGARPARKYRGALLLLFSTQHLAEMSTC